jgi:ABC-2 type transport system ATP-binding protein
LRDGQIQVTRPLADLRERMKRVVLHRVGGWTHPPVVAGVLKTHVQGDQAVLLVEDPVMDSLHALAAREHAGLRIETPTLEDLFVELA